MYKEMPNNWPAMDMDMIGVSIGWDIENDTVGSRLPPSRPKELRP